MNRLKMVVYASVGLFLLAVAVPAGASAAMELPVFNPANASTSTSGKGAVHTEEGAIGCNSATGQLLFNSGSTNLGAFTLDFKECSLLGEECHSLGDAAKTILLAGTWHLVLLLEGTTDRHLILFLIAETHIECAFLSLLYRLKGDFEGTIEPIGAEPTEKFKVNVNSVKNEGKVQEFVKWENDAGTVEKTELLTSIDEGTFKNTIWESQSNELKTKEGAPAKIEK